MNVYISGALMGSRDIQAARSAYEFAAQCVEDVGHHAYVPHLHTDPVLCRDMTPGQVFESDVGQLADADFVIAFLDEPSLGVGAELALASTAGTPVLALHREGKAVSRFVMGLLSSKGNVVCTYSSPADIRSAISQALRVSGVVRFEGQGYLDDRARN